jgi:hypothetical protein
VDDNDPASIRRAIASLQSGLRQSGLAGSGAANRIQQRSFRAELDRLRVDYGAARVAMPRRLLELVEGEPAPPSLGEGAVLRALVHANVFQSRGLRRPLPSEA